MKHYTRQISIEPFVSRLPGVIPSFKRGGITPYYFCQPKGSVREEINSNYGMIPCNIPFIGIEPNDEYGITILPTADLTKDNRYIMSYVEMIRIYHFLEKCVQILISPSNCKKYDNFNDYFKSEVIRDNLSFDVDKEYYAKLDKKFKNFGGLRFYDMLSTTFFPSVDIADLGGDIDVWKISKLYYQDLKREIDWFTTMRTKKDCCNDSLYDAKGGDKMLDRLIKYKEIIEKQTNGDDKVRGLNDYFWKDATLKELRDELYPKIIEPIHLTSTEATMGEYSPITGEFVPGENYASTIKPSSSTKAIGPGDNYVFIVNDDIAYVDMSKQTRHVVRVVSKKTAALDANIKIVADGGTTVFHDNDSYIIKTSTSGLGYTYDEEINELKFGNETVKKLNGNSYVDNKVEMWKDYTKAYIQTNFHEEFYLRNGIVRYAHSKDGGIEIVNRPSDVLKERLCDAYKIENSENGWFTNGTVLLPIKKEKYVVLKSNHEQLDGTKFIVKYSNIGTPYIVVNKEEVYASRVNGNWVFLFDGKTSTIENGKEYVEYGGTRYFVESSGLNEIIIEREEFYRIDGYTSVDGTKMYINGEEIFILNDNIEKEMVDKTKLYIKNGFVYISYIDYDTETYPYGEITGYTTSKLKNFTESTSFDGLGNPLPGIIPPTNLTNIRAAKSGMFLNLIYKVGAIKNVKNIQKGDKKLYYGDYLEKIELAHPYDTNLSITITNPTVDVTSIINDYIKRGQPTTNYLNARITYHIGTSLIPNDSNTLEPKYYTDAFNHTTNGFNGITYIEDVKIVKKSYVYYNNANTNPMPIFYYDVEGTKEIKDSEEYQGEINETIAFFRTPLPRLKFDGSYDVKYSEHNGFSKDMCRIASPIFRKEYQLGIATPEIVEGNVNIDRGIHSVFEKTIKLGEVATFNAMERYANGYFNMTKVT